MQFSLATIALLAGAAAAQVTTVYTTDVETITSCGPTVTNCPARSHTSAPAPAWTPSSQVVPPAVTSVAPAPGTTVAPAPAPGTSVAPAPKGNTSPVAPYPSPSVSVVTYSTCIPTTIVSTITLTPSPTSVAPVGTAPPAPAGTAPGAPGTGATTTHPGSPAFTNGANAFSGSFAMAGAAAVAAVFLA